MLSLSKIETLSADLSKAASKYVAASRVADEAFHDHHLKQGRAREAEGEFRRIRDALSDAYLEAASPPPDEPALKAA